jgi:hypothetical protein
MHETAICQYRKCPSNTGVSSGRRLHAELTIYTEQGSFLLFVLSTLGAFALCASDADQYGKCDAGERRTTQYTEHTYSHNAHSGQKKQEYDQEIHNQE